MGPDLLSRLSLRQLRLVAAVIEHGQLSLAADELGITQPAASRTLADMERLLGVTLFERRTRGMVPTEVGEAFALRAGNVLRELGAGIEEVAHLVEGLSGSVSVGAVTGAAVGHVMPVVRDFRARAPGVEIEIQTGMSGELVRGLLAHRFDLVMSRLPDAFDVRLFDVVPAAAEEVVLMCRSGHPVLDGGPVPMGGLADLDWVMQARGAPIRVTVEAALRAAAAPPPRQVLVSQSLLVTLAALRGSDMVTPVSAETAELVIDGIGASGVDRIPLDAPLTVPPYSIVTLRDRSLGPAAAQFLALLRERLAPTSIS